MRNYHIHHWLTALILFPLVILGAQAKAQEAAPAAPQVSEAHLAELIQQLGAEEFSARQLAQTELARIGLEAVDALQEAQRSDDVEIALRARYLVRGMQIQWFTATDPAEVARVLKGYGDLDHSGRRSRMDRLASLADNEGIPVLCRLVKYEPDGELAKHAALLVIQQPEVTEAAPREALAKQIDGYVGKSRRTAAAWLKAYAKTLRDPAGSLAEWDQIVQAENKVLQQSPQTTNAEIVSSLFQWQIILQQRTGKKEEAVANMQRLVGVAGSETDQLLLALSWLVEHEGYSIVQETADKFHLIFAESPELLYVLAESQRKAGNTTLADASAIKASQLNPDNPDPHRVLAYKLGTQGLYDWAEVEYRIALANYPPMSLMQIRVFGFLAEILHDQAKDLEAGKTLQELTDLVEQDPKNREKAENNGETTFPSRYSRKHYFFACHYTAQGDAVKARSELEAAITHEPTDADVLIALYRLPNSTPAQTKAIHKLIDECVEDFADKVNQARSEVEKAERTSDEYLLEASRKVLGLECNQYAWIVSNTYGDFDEALRCGLQAVELNPEEAGRIDTLGRCYWAKKDFARAVKVQGNAVKLEPHGGQLRRQLAFFEKEMAAQQAQNNAAPQP